MFEGALSEDEQRSDEELIEKVRDGNTDAYRVLWSRHFQAGVAVARSYTSRVDPEDVASEAFARTMEAIGRGKGPQVAFRPYLLTVVRNTASTWGKASAMNTALDELVLEDPRFGDAALEDAMDRSTVVTGFASLPLRWQEVLWYTEVEQLSPAETGALMGGIKPTAVSALAYRAREGLRLAWIRAHLTALPDDSECRWAADRLPALQRNSLLARDRARLESHLADCEFCSLVLEEAEDSARRLSTNLLSAFAGPAAVAAYLLDRARRSPQAGVEPDPATASAASRLAPKVLAAYLGVALIVGGTSIAGIAALRSASVDRTDLRAPAPSSTRTVPTPTTQATTSSPDRRVHPGASPTPTPTLTPTVRPALTPTASPAENAPLGAPIVLQVDSGTGRFFPVIAGTGVPGATVKVRSATTTFSTRVGSDGRWASPTIDDARLGLNELSVTQISGRTESPPTAAEVLLAPIRVSPAPHAAQHDVVVTGLVNASVMLSSNGATLRVVLGPSGSATVTLPASWTAVTAVYVGPGRTGPDQTYAIS